MSLLSLISLNSASRSVAISERSKTVSYFRVSTSSLSLDVSELAM